jgi:hypothetical protein
MKNTLTVEMGGRKATIPQAWLMGCTYSYQKQGMAPKAATVAAIQQWFAQADMAAEFEAQRETVAA